MWQHDKHTTAPITLSRPSPCRLLLINRPRRDGTLSWRWYTTAMCGILSRGSRSQVRHTLPHDHKCIWKPSLCYCGTSRCSGDNNRLDIRGSWSGQSNESAGNAIQSATSQDGSEGCWGFVCLWLLHCFQNAGLCLSLFVYTPTVLFCFVFRQWSVVFRARQHTRVYQSKTVEVRIMKFSPYCSSISLASAPSLWVSASLW